MQYLDYNGLSTFKSLLDKIYPKLDDNNKIPSSYLPSYVDDVLEFDTLSSFPTTGESGKIYLTADTNKSYRWTGSGYAEISSSLALGETSATAYRGDRGKIAYDHSQKSHSLTIAGNSVSALGGTLTKDTLLTSLGLSSAASDITSLKAHVANGDIHVTADDKTTWNSAVETLDTHTKDTTIHITSDERTKWNNNIANLSNHIADSTKHITASERKAWNAKWDYNEATIKAVKVNNATTADKVGHTLTFADGTTFNGSADKSIGKAQVGLDKVENKTITVTSSSVSDGTNTFNKYIHPTHSAVTIASADGRVLGNISVDSLGHVTSVGYKALGFVDIPSLYIGKTKIQSSSAAQALTGISSLTLEGSTAELKWDNDKSAWRLSGNLLVDGFVASGGTGSSGGSSGGAVDVSYVANLTAGTLLGTLTINGTDYQILAPSLTASSINAALGNTPVARATADAEGNSISGTYAKTSALPTKVSQLTNDSGYLTAITKAMVEGVLTGNITSHTHSQYLTAHQSVGLASGTNNGTLKLTVGGAVTDNIAVKGLGSAAYTNSSAYASASHTHTFASLTEKPTTISGYGITDAYTKTETDTKLSGYLPLTGGAINGYLQIGAIDNTSYNHLVLFRSGRFARINNTPTDAYFSFGTVSDTGTLTAEKVLQIGDNGLKYSPDNSSYYNILHSGNYNSYSPKLDGTGATGNWGINITGGLTIPYINSESEISGDYLKAYAGVGGAWTGEISSMAYAAILGIGYPNRGFQLWAMRGEGTAGSLYYRVGTTDASTWNTERILIDNEIINSYAPNLTGKGASGTWGINISGDADTLDGQHNIGQVSNWNSWVGSFRISAEDTATNAPANGYHYGYQMQFHRSPAVYYTDLITNLYRDELYFRRHDDTGYGAWRQFAFLDSNVASSSKWSTARTITLTGSVTGSVSIDGSANVTLATTTNHTHNYAGSSSAGGEANSARTLVYVNHFDINYGSYAVFQQDAGRSDLPHTGWFNTIKMLHNNSSGYFTEIATSFTGEDGMWRRALCGGAQAGWYKMLDSGNYNSYSPKLDGTGATGDWGINISGNAATVGGITGALIPTTNASTGYWGSLGYGSNGKLSIGTNYGGVAWNAQNFGAGLMFGCELDTHGFISIGFNSPIVSFAGSNNSNASNDNPNWYFKLTGTSGTTYDLNCAPAATKLATARTLWGQSFDGTGDVTTAPNLYIGTTKVQTSSASQALTGITDLGMSGRLSNGVGRYGLYVNGSAADYGSAIYLTHDHGTNQTAFRILSHYEDAVGALSIGFSTTTQDYKASPLNATYAEIVHIRGNGNVGIRTTSPSSKLHVNGSLRASSLTLNGTNLLEWDESNSAWKFNGNLIATGFIASGDISAQAAALAEEEDRIAALEAQVAELQAEIENLKAS